MMPFSPSDPASSETRTPPSTPIHRCTSLIGSQPLCLATTSGIRTILSANKTNSTWVTKSCFILCTHQVPRLDHKITICRGITKNSSGSHEIIIYLFFKVASATSIEFLPAARLVLNYFASLVLVLVISFYFLLKFVDIRS